MYRVVQNRISVKKLASSMRGTVEVLGNDARIISAIAPIGDASSRAITFCIRKGDQGVEMVRKSGAGVIICHNDLPLTSEDLKDKTFILVSDPRSAFIKVMKEYFLEEKIEYGTHPTAVVHQDAEIHPNVYIGPYCCIGKCKIGGGTVIYGSNYIHANTRIGRNVTIQAGTVIGAESVSFQRIESGELERFPQLGGVVIEDDVWIGANTSIVRGTMEDTIIGKGTMIGHQCCIGHSSIIGRHCAITSCTMIGGHCRVGDASQIGLSACIRNGITIGRNVVVGMGSVVTKDVGDGKVVFGVPAKEQGEVQG